MVTLRRYVGIDEGMIDELDDAGTLEGTHVGWEVGYVTANGVEAKVAFVGTNEGEREGLRVVFATLASLPVSIAVELLVGATEEFCVVVDIRMVSVGRR